MKDVFRRVCWVVFGTMLTGFVALMLLRFVMQFPISDRALWWGAA